MNTIFSTMISFNIQKYLCLNDELIGYIIFGRIGYILLSNMLKCIQVFTNVNIYTDVSSNYC